MDPLCLQELYTCLKCLIQLVLQGRLIDLIKKKALNLQRVTYLVFDEADRMFDMGFGKLISLFHVFDMGFVKVIYLFHVI